METIARRVMEGREALGYTQAQLAELMPCNPQTVSNWETGRRQPRYADLVRLAEVLRRPVSWFLGEESGDGSWRQVQDALERVRRELEAVEQQVGRQSRPAPAGEGLLPIVGRVVAGPRSEIVAETVGWRRLHGAASPGLRLLQVDGDAHHPLLREGDIVGVEPATAAEPHTLVTARLADGTEVLKRWGDDNALESVNPMYAPLRASDAQITGVVAWLQRDFAAPDGDAADGARESFEWLQQSPDEVDAVAARIEQGEGQWQELRTLCDRVAATAGRLRPVYGSAVDAPAARALSLSARSLGEQGRYADAHAAAEQAEDSYRRLERVGERSRDALNNLYNLSQLALFLGDVDAAEQAAEQAAACDDWRVRWKALKNLAEIQINFRGRADESAAWERILELADAGEDDDPVQAALARAVAYEIRGNAALARGDLAEARAAAADELAAAEDAGLPYRVANACCNVAQYAVIAGDAEAARAATDRAGELTAAQDLGDLEAMRRAHAAAAAALSGDLPAARRTLHRAMRLAAALASPRSHLMAELAGLLIAAAEGDPAARDDHAEAARESARAMGLAGYDTVIDRMLRGNDAWNAG